MSHEAVLVKVNAKVDRGIAPLVEALNSLPCLFTLSSCEGDKQAEAYVAFHVGESWDKLGNFIQWLSSGLGKDKTISDMPFSLSIEWHAGGGTPTGYVRVPHRHVQTLSRAICEIAQRSD